MQVKVDTCPSCDSSNDSIVLVLGLLLQRIARRCGVPEMSSIGPTFVRDVRRALCAGFTALRVDADEAGDREVFNLLAAEAPCKSILAKLCTRPAVVDRAFAPVPRGSAARCAGSEGDGSEVKALRVLTWNVSQTSVNPVSLQAPQNSNVWSAGDNLSLIHI